LDPRIGIVTVSDTRSEADDLSGPSAVEALRDLGYRQFETRLVKDEIIEIQSAILSLVETCHLVFTTGGTGFSPRDVTPEATAPLLDRRADSLVELMRYQGLKHTPLAHLSRAVAGMVKGVLVVNLPGSPKAVRQDLDALAPLLKPILESLFGEGCEHPQ
jgi:molybdopterin adenylyltransferase